MSDTKTFHPEFLRPVEYISEPDPRNLYFVRPNSETGELVPLTTDDYHKAVSKLVLNKTVPEDIIIQFETAKNLYLYAWFVYRFYPVSEHHALVCLELALRKRYAQEILRQKRKRRTKPTLRPLLRYAIDCSHVKNEGFRRWHEAANRKAYFRYQMEKSNEMYEKGLDRIDLDYSEVTVTDADRNCEYLNSLIKHLPWLRNHYAHGASTLHDQVLGTFEVVSEIINQIYPGK